jgi:hypothetical protein
MTVTAQAGVFSLAPQAAKLGDSTFSIGDYSWYRYKAMSANIGVQEMQDLQPLEVGGVIVPTGAYKSGAFFGGSVELLPRIEGDIGWLIYALMGSVSTVSNSPETGLYTHYFRYPESQTAIKYLALRKVVPEASGAAYGEGGYDSIVAAAQFTVPQSGQVTSRFDFLGRVPFFEDDPSGWIYADDYEDFQSIPLSCKGGFSIGGVSYPLLGAQVAFNIQTTTPQQEMIVGAYHPDDFAMLSKGVSIKTTLKWANADLYNEIRTGSSTGATWSPFPLLKESGVTEALELYVESPGNISGKSHPYSLKFLADKVTIRADGPPTLEPGNMVTIPLTIDVIDPGSSNQYFEVVLVNEQSGYAWPT